MAQDQGAVNQKTTPISPRHRAALAFAADGIPVFPCIVNGKAPATRNGFKDASTDPAHIDAWWQQADYNVGCRPIDLGCIVIDIDIGHDPAELADLPVTRTVITPSGGEHRYYKTFESFGNGAYAGHIDVRSANGYVLCPPSIVGGREYRIKDPAVPIAPLPEHVAARLRRRADAIAQPVAEPDCDPGQWAIDGAKAYLASLNGSDPGRFEVACALARNYGLRDATAIALWEASGVRTEPRNSGDSLETKLAHARLYGTGTLGSGVAHWAWLAHQAAGADPAAAFANHVGEPKADWRTKIVRSKKAKGLDLARNARLVLREHPDFAGRLSYDEFARRPVVQGPLPWRPADTLRRWEDADDNALAGWLQDHGILVTRRVAGDAVDLVAREHSFHPVKDYLNGLSWDGWPRLDGMLARHFAAREEPPEYLAAVGSRWAISAVARIFEPGCQADHCLIFEGLRQGESKSSALRALAVRDDWFADQLPDDISSRSASLCLDGKWLIELSELSAMRRSDVEPLKAFISRRVEHYDPKFSNRTVDVPRQCVFAGSTNETEYLRDPTGNRRFWPVRCGSAIDLAALVADRDQLWAEAVRRYRAGERWWIDRAAEPELAGIAEDVQRERLVTTSLDDELDDYLNGHRPVQPKPLMSVSIAEIFTQLYGVTELRHRDPRIEQGIARRLTAIGWQRRKIRQENGSREMRYFRPVRGPYRRFHR